MKINKLFFLLASVLLMFACNQNGGNPPQVKRITSFMVPGLAKITWANEKFTITLVDTAGKPGESKSTDSEIIMITFTEAMASGGGIGVIVLEDTSAIPVTGYSKIASILALGFELEKMEDGTIVITSDGVVVAILDSATCTPFYLKKVIEDGKVKIEVWVPEGCIQLP